MQYVDGFVVFMNEFYEITPDFVIQKPDSFGDLLIDLHAISA